MADVSREQIVAAIKVTLAIAETIKELGSVPSGELYALLCGKMSLNQYQIIIGNIERAGMITVKNNLITWIGD
jgi:hypothetical protein